MTSSPGRADEIPLPVLDGNVPYCDPRTKAMNLRLDAAADPVLVQAQLASGEMAITIGGSAAVCSVPESNPPLVSCTADPNVVFPAQVIVTDSGNVANDFEYDGKGCLENQSEGGGDEAPAPGPPACTGTCP